MMKNIKYIALLLLGMVAFGCQEDPLVKIDPDTFSAPTFSSVPTATDMVLTEENGAENVTFQWNAANYGMKVVVKYAFQGKKSTDTDYQVISSGAALSYTTSKNALNGLLMAWGCVPEEPTAIDFRVVASLEGSNEQISEVATISVTCFEGEIAYKFLCLPGSYQNPTWTPAGNMIYSQNGDGIYEGYVDMRALDNTAGFLVLDNSTEYDGFKWGADPANPAGLIHDDGAGNILTGTPGYNLMHVDMNTATFWMKDVEGFQMKWGAADGSWTDTQDLTWNAVTLSWDLNSFEPATDGYIVFTSIKENITLGGSLKKLVNDGAGIALEAGKYKISMVAGNIAFPRVDMISMNLNPDNFVAPVLTMGESYSFTKADKDNALDPALTWTAAEYGAEGAITYNVMADDKVLFTTTELTWAPTVGEFNAALAEAAFVPDTEATINFTVVSDFSGSYPQTSNAVAVTVTPYAAGNAPIYMPGSYQDWSFDETCWKLEFNETMGYYWGRFTFAEDVNFKFVDGPSWSGYQELLPSVRSEAFEGKGLPFNADGFVSGAIAIGGSDIALAAGTYIFTMNVEAMTYSMQHVDGIWSIIGEAVGGWDYSNDIFMVGGSESGIWTIRANFPATGGYKFRRDNDWAVNLGGSLDALTDGGDNLNMEAAGWYDVTLNTNTNTATVVAVTEFVSANGFLGVPGNHQGWNPGEATTRVYPATTTIWPKNESGFGDLDDSWFMGYLNLVTEDDALQFKFIDGTEWGAQDWGGTLVGATDGTLYDGDGEQNITGMAEGYYLLLANIDQAAWKAVPVQFGLIGSATTGGWDTSTPMTYDAENHIWKVTTTLVDGEFKFRANDGWNINYGGDINNLAYDGGNIAATAGNFVITLDVSSVPYKATIGVAAATF